MRMYKDKFINYMNNFLIDGLGITDITIEEFNMSVDGSLNFRLGHALNRGNNIYFTAISGPVHQLKFPHAWVSIHGNVPIQQRKIQFDESNLKKFIKVLIFNEIVGEK